MALVAQQHPPLLASFHAGTHMVLLAMAMRKRLQVALSSEDVARPGESCDNEHAVRTPVCAGSHARVFLPYGVEILHGTAAEHTSILS